MNTTALKTCVLGIVLVMLGAACCISVQSDGTGDGGPAFEKAPESGWTPVTLSNQTITGNEFVTTGTVDKAEISGMAVQRNGNDYLVLFKDWEADLGNYGKLPFSIDANGADVKLYIEGQNSISVVNGGLMKVTNGGLYIYIASSSSLTVHTTYDKDQSWGGSKNTFEGNTRVVGEDRSSSVLSFENDGADQSNFAAALQGCLGISNVTVSYRYAPEYLAEDPEKVVNPGEYDFTYAPMCHKFFLQTENVTISDSTIDVYGAYWGFNNGNTVIEDSTVDMTACDVAFSVKTSMSIVNSTVNASTLWKMAWSDSNGTDNHIPAAFSIGSPGNGNDQTQSTLSIDGRSTVTAMGVRYYNNTVVEGEPSLENLGRLTVEPSSFDDPRYPDQAGYGMTASQNYKDGQTATTSAFSFVNEGTAEINAPLDVSSMGEDVVSTVTNYGLMDLNSSITVQTGSQIVNYGSVIYTENASGMGAIENHGGTVESDKPEYIPPEIWDDDFVPPVYYPQTQPAEEDDTVTVIACAAAAVVAALLAVFLVVERKH